MVNVEVYPTRIRLIPYHRPRNGERLGWAENVIPISDEVRLLTYIVRYASMLIMRRI